MGTRADFYMGRGTDAEWLGSCAWDGYPDGLRGVMAATDCEAYLAAVEARPGKDDATRPEQGWPWPWEDSRLTDYAYAWCNGEVWVARFGRGWVARADVLTADGESPSFDGLDKRRDFPDMTERQRVTLGPRSGVIVACVHPRGKVEVE